MTPNEVTALDAAMSFSLHIGRQCRGASEFLRWADIIQNEPVAVSISQYEAHRNDRTAMLATILCDYGAGFGFMFMPATNHRKTCGRSKTE